MEDIKIRLASISDSSQIADFNCRMAEETENFILDPETALSGVTNLFKKPELGFYVVAIENNNIAGSLMITTEWSDWRDGIIWWIQSVYIRPEHRRKGIFRELYHFIKERAKENNIAGLRLYVEQNNNVAQRTYKSLGMLETSYKLFEDIF